MNPSLVTKVISNEDTRPSQYPGPLLVILDLLDNHDGETMNCYTDLFIGRKNAFVAVEFDDGDWKLWCCTIYINLSSEDGRPIRMSGHSGERYHGLVGLSELVQ